MTPSEGWKGLPFAGMTNYRMEAGITSGLILSVVIPAKAGIHKAKDKVNMNTYYVYIMASQKNGTLYIGVTNDLLRRVGEHKQGIVEGFTQKHEVKMLVWFEETADVEAAILREKQMKKWNRAWKIELIQQMNPLWRDLYEDFF
jgi:putative endonuclease